MRICKEPRCEDETIPVDLAPCPECCPEDAQADAEDRAEKKKAESLARELSNWYVRALGTVAAYQHYGLEVPKLSYQMIVFATISSDHPGMVKYLKEYVEVGQRAFEAKGFQ